jgi:hypothetical protein
MYHYWPFSIGEREYPCKSCVFIFFISFSSLSFSIYLETSSTIVHFVGLYGLPPSFTLPHGQRLRKATMDV